MSHYHDTTINSLWKRMSSHNLFCLFYGFKKVMKQPVRLADVEFIEVVLLKLDLSYVLSDFFYENPNENCHWSDKNKIIYISRDMHEATLAKEYDACFAWEFYVNHTRSYKYNAETAKVWLWRLLWYPSCCINKFLKSDVPDDSLFYAHSDRAVDYMNCSSFLNQFENIILHHIPCSYNCQHSIILAKAMFPYYLSSYQSSLREGIKESLYSEKTYVLFKSLNWIKLQGGIFSFGSLLNRWDSLFSKVKLLLDNGFLIRILDGTSIELYDSIKTLTISNVQVLHFPEISMLEDKILWER